MKKRILQSVCLITFFAFMTVSCNTNSSDKSSVAEYDFTFAFLTDIHVEYGKNADKGFQQAIDHVNGMKPDFIVTGGDLISDALGQTEEKATELYDLYLELIEGFEAPLYNTLGNHEEFGFYERSGVSTDHALYGDLMYEERIGARYYAFNEKGWRFYILDSVDETEERRYYGNVDSVQMEWLIADLASVNPLTPIVISTHIPLLTSFTQIRDGALAQNTRGLVVENSKAVLDAFKDHNLKLVLQGHLHILEEAYINDIHFITGGAVCARWWEGARDGMEEGYLLVKVKGEEFDWEYVDYGWVVE